MDDIVQRLRRGIALDGGMRHYVNIPLMDEAADVISALREIKMLDSDQQDVTDKITDLQNERDWALEENESLKADLWAGPIQKTNRIRLKLQANGNPLVQELFINQFGQRRWFTISFVEVAEDDEPDDE